MARKPRSEREGSNEAATAALVEPAVEPEAAAPPPPQPDDVVVAEEISVPPPQMLVVTAVPSRGMVSIGGFMTRMPLGKRIDPRGYNLEALRQQGVKLEPV